LHGFYFNLLNFDVNYFFRPKTFFLNYLNTLGLLFIDENSANLIEIEKNVFLLSKKF
jgi:hypothetical protein